MHNGFDEDPPGFDGESFGGNGFDDAFENDPEGPSQADLERFGDEFRPCPNCGTDVYDQLEFCPNCGDAITEPTSKPPLGVVIVGVVALLAFLLVLLF